MAEEVVAKKSEKKGDEAPVELKDVRKLTIAVLDSSRRLPQIWNVEQVGGIGGLMLRHELQSMGLMETFKINNTSKRDTRRYNKRMGTTGSLEDWMLANCGWLRLALHESKYMDEGGTG
ncbi:hypothetical protein L596_010320 [Steinernema carpocapsae]|uniref:Uncharacterized protein n=1 Tax=Steinernema carpocapsae TaxID=34508 RepID=A0A4U5PJB1_STECR|nr:hypothetical protein L596_010320 [Steinernema carpocapsae]